MFNTRIIPQGWPVQSKTGDLNWHLSVHDPFIAVGVYTDWLISWLCDQHNEGCWLHIWPNFQQWIPVLAAPPSYFPPFSPHMLHNSFSILTGFKKNELLTLYAYFPIKIFSLFKVWNTEYWILNFHNIHSFFFFWKLWNFSINKWDDLGLFICYQNVVKPADKDSSVDPLKYYVISRRKLNLKKVWKGTNMGKNK